MHKLALILCLAATTTSAGAQSSADNTLGIKLPTAKGTWMLGTDLAFGQVNFYGGSADYSLSIRPKAAYFVTDNLAIGAGVFGTITHYQPYSSQSYTLMPFARYYFGKQRAGSQPAYPQTRFFIEGGVGALWAYGRVGSDGGGDDKWHSSGVGYNAYIMPGVSVFLNRHVALDGGIYFQHTGIDRSFTNFNTIGFNLGLKVFLGKR